MEDKTNNMETINLNTGEGYKLITFPDGQPHIVLEDEEIDYYVKVICSITSPSKLLQLCEVAEVLNRHSQSWILHIPYLMGARWDRVMEDEKGSLRMLESFDLKVVADIINSLKANVVVLYDPHSDVASALINNCKIISNKNLVISYEKEDAVLIIPDAGAAKKANKYFKWNSNLKDSIQCVKHRDSEGKITLKVLEPEKCTSRNCVIVDDLCDGGRTFIAIAQQIKPLHLTLIVTHGIFSAGLKGLAEEFQEIITSNSYQVDYKEGSGILKVINYDF